MLYSFWDIIYFVILFYVNHISIYLFSIINDKFLMILCFVVCIVALLIQFILEVGNFSIIGDIHEYLFIFIFLSIIYICILLIIWCM